VVVVVVLAGGAEVEDTGEEAEEGEAEEEKLDGEVDAGRGTYWPACLAKKSASRTRQAQCVCAPRQGGPLRKRTHPLGSCSLRSSESSEDTSC
jgi:hypothetical protein